ncbi:MAG: AAA family ATPase, partial [Natronospirillum sp.]
QEPGAVMMLAAEDDRDEIARRLHAIIRHLEPTPEQADMLGKNFYPVSRLGIDNRITHKVNGVIEWNIQLIKKIIDTAKVLPDLRLIILDPVSRFRSGDENASEDATKFVEALEIIRQRTGVTVLTAHHSRKGSSGESQDDIRGASAFVDALRFAATLYRPMVDAAKKLGIPEKEAPSWIRLSVVKSNYQTELDQQWLRRGPGGVLEATDPPAKPEKHQERGEERYTSVLPKLKELIRKADTQGDKLTKTSITKNHSGKCGIFGCGDQVLRGIISRALEEGEIKQEDGGCLRLY